jgi:hypothetical protein
MQQKPSRGPDICWVVSTKSKVHYTDDRDDTPIVFPPSPLSIPPRFLLLLLMRPKHLLLAYAAGRWRKEIYLVEVVEVDNAWNVFSSFQEHWVQKSVSMYRAPDGYSWVCSVLSIACNMLVILCPVHDSVSVDLSIAVETSLIVKHDIVRSDSLWFNDSQSLTKWLLKSLM